MFLINGHKQESLAVSDRATQFGDGCFTTARVIDGKVSLLSAHIQRLQDACQRLMISCDFWPQQTRDENAGSRTAEWCAESRDQSR